MAKDAKIHESKGSTIQNSRVRVKQAHGSKTSKDYCILECRNKMSEKQSLLVTAGGRILCRRCSARAKRSGQQCQSPAMSGKNVCRVHGGKSRGPITAEGRARCAATKLIHGRETRAKREQASRASKAVRAASLMLSLVENGQERQITRDMIQMLLGIADSQHLDE